jgi:cytochrome c
MLTLYVKPADSASPNFYRSFARNEKLSALLRTECVAMQRDATRIVRDGVRKAGKTAKPIYRACYWVWGMATAPTDPRGNSKPSKKSNRKECEMRGVIFAAVLAVASASGARAQDAAAGEKVFAVCKACHQIGETAKNAVGPVLNGIIGRPAGTYAGYSYSDANKNSGLTWDEATFRDYIKDPRAKIPGTKMIYPGLKDEQKTTDLLAYLKQFDADGKKK